MISYKVFTILLEDYKIPHRPPNSENGAPLHDLTRSYPDDIYSSKARQYYGDGSPLDNETIRMMHSHRNKPENDVDIYRAVPKNVSAQINDGDWVTINKNYAKEHGEGQLDGNYKIIKKKVKAKHIFGNADSIHEYGYHPDK